MANSNSEDWKSSTVEKLQDAIQAARDDIKSNTEFIKDLEPILNKRRVRYPSGFDTECDYCGKWLKLIRQKTIAQRPCFYTLLTNQGLILRASHMSSILIS